MQFPSWELRSLSWALVITPPNNGLADGAPVTPKSKARPNQNITGTYIAESPNIYLFYFLAAEHNKHRAPPGSRKVFEYFWIFIFHLLSKYKRQRKSQAKKNIENNHLLCQEVFDYSIQNIYNKFYFWRQQQNMSFFA